MVQNRRLAAALVASALMLSGCAPLGLFARGGSEYSAYRSSWGMYVASSKVNTLCLVPALRLAILEIEGHFGKKVVVNSGYRTSAYNGEVGGADASYHRKCMAADLSIPGVSKSQLIAYAKRVSLIGGLGCYPGRTFIHIDVRPRPRGARGPLTFSGC